MTTSLYIILAFSVFYVYNRYKRAHEAELDREAQAVLDAVKAARDEVDAVTEGVKNAEIDYEKSRNDYRAKYHPNSDDESKG